MGNMHYTIFDMKTNILLDLHIYIRIPLINIQRQISKFMTYLRYSNFQNMQTCHYPDQAV